VPPGSRRKRQGQDHSDSTRIELRQLLKYPDYTHHRVNERYRLVTSIIAYINNRHSDLGPLDGKRTRLVTRVDIQMAR